MRKFLFVVIAAMFTLSAVPSFATTCSIVYSGPFAWYQCISNPYFYQTMSPWTWAPGPSNGNPGNVDWIHSGEQMCGTGWRSFAKSTGAYGYETIEQQFITDGSAQNNFDIALSVDLLHSHSYSANRLAITVYNVTDGTAETVANIDGSGGDICSRTYQYSLFRPSWAGKTLKLSIQEQFWNSDTQINVSGASFIQRIY